MKKKLLIKFLDNRCTSEELAEVLEWINKEALSDKGKKLVRDDWKTFKTAEDTSDSNEKFSSLLDKIHHKININGHAVKQGKTASLLTWLTRVAAFLLIPVLIFLIYSLPDNPFYTSRYYSDLVVDSLEIISPIGARTVMQLSDGTEVHLNYGSSIKYPRTFNGDTREVVLLGEAYFEVAHNPEKPFIVKTGKLNVKALGTRFNVLAYPDNNVVATTLIEGEVVLEQPDADGNTRTIETMSPGQHVDYNAVAGITSSTKGNVEKYIAWKDGLLVFDNVSITGVANRLERMFNVDIEIADDVAGYSYTVTFVDESLFQILDLMTLSTPVRYKTLPREKLSDGTYSKQKILLEKK